MPFGDGRRISMGLSKKQIKQKTMQLEESRKQAQIQKKKDIEAFKKKIGIKGNIDLESEIVLNKIKELLKTNSVFNKDNPGMPQKLTGDIFFKENYITAGDKYCGHYPQLIFEDQNAKQITIETDNQFIDLYNKLIK